jgi:hypothetical protein
VFSAVLVRDEEQVGARQQQEHLPGQEWWVLLFIFLFLLSAAPSLHYPIAPQGVFTAWVAPWCSILFICSSIRAYFVASATPLLTGFAQSCTGCFCRILLLEKHKNIWSVLIPTKKNLTAKNCKNAFMAIMRVFLYLLVKVSFSVSGLNTITSNAK